MKRGFVRSGKHKMCALLNKDCNFHKATSCSAVHLTVLNEDFFVNSHKPAVDSKKKKMRDELYVEAH